MTPVAPAAVVLVVDARMLTGWGLVNEPDRALLALGDTVIPENEVPDAGLLTSVTSTASRSPAAIVFLGLASAVVPSGVTSTPVESSTPVVRSTIDMVAALGLNEPAGPVTETTWFWVGSTVAVA